MTDRPALLDALRAIVGAPHVLAEGDLSAYEQDWRRRAHGRALAATRGWPWVACPTAAARRWC